MIEHSVYQPLLDRIDALLKTETPIYVAIDGDAAAGKSSLASCLHKTYGCNVIPMDHFFLQSHQRTETRLAEPGGNVDYERFKAEVQTPLLRSEAFSYRPFNCQIGKLGDSVDIIEKRLNVIEGAYSLHPTLADMYHIKVFCTISAEEQLRRIEARNGEILRERFRREWIPMEKRYFAAFDIQNQCDFIFGEESDS